MKPPRFFKALLPPSFAWREHNYFALRIDGDVYFPRMLAAIGSATSQIDLEMYLASSGRVFSQFRDALIAARSRNVRVRVLFDAFGSHGVSVQDRQQLTAAGVQILFYNQLRWRKGLANLLRNHRKLLLVDGRVGFVGGTGLTDEFIDLEDRAWHEVMVEIQGEVLPDWQRLFERTWSGLRRQWRASIFTRINHESTEDVATTVPVAQMRGRVIASRGVRAHRVSQSLYAQIRQTHRRVWLATPYFLPPRRLQRLLMGAARRGVDVRILVPGPSTDLPGVRLASRSRFGRLLEHGVRIYEFQPRFIHAKIALCDFWTSIGSTNFDRWNLRWNLDANQEINDAQFAEQVASLFRTDFAQAVELDARMWPNRPWWQRFYEKVSAGIERLLRRLAR